MSQKNCMTEEEKQIDEMACTKCLHQFVCLIHSDDVPTPCSEYEDKAGYRKQIEGEWIYEVEHYWDDYGDLIVYVIAHCANCGTPYRENHSVDWEHIERPENLGYHADWNIDVEPIKKMVLERAKTIKLTQNYCSNCGAHMSGGNNE